MPVFLKNRQSNLVEFMDRDDCDPVKLNNTYKHFRLINVLLSNWKKIYREYLKPVLSDTDNQPTLLDIGFGGGDIPFALNKWATEDHIDLQITGIEPDKRAFDFATTLPPQKNIEFRQVNSSTLLERREEYDVVISNHVLHHLEGEAFYNILEDAKKLAKKLVIFNDIERSDLGYLLFTTLTRPLFFNSFIIDDGLISIKRSYTKTELQKKVPEGWEVVRSFPFRLLLIYRKP